MTTSVPGGPILVKGKNMHALPVVSIVAGEVLADVKDLIYSPSAGSLLGVTLNKHGGLFAGPLKQTLWIQAIHALGRDAVMVADETALNAPPPAPTRSGDGDNDSGSGRNVIGNQVLTDAGSAIGVVTDLIVEIGMLAADRRVGSVVGYEVTGDATLQGREGKPLLLPLPYTLAVSGTTLVVPTAVESFIRDDLSGFGAAVSDYRAQLDTPAAPGSVRKIEP